MDRQESYDTSGLPQEKKPYIEQDFNQPAQPSQTTNPNEPVESPQTASETELSQLTPNSTQPKRSSKIPLIIVLIIVLIGAVLIVVFFILKTKDQNKDTKSQSQITTQPTRKQPSHYTGSQTIKLNDVSGGTNKGSVTRRITEGLVTHTLQAQLPELEEGYVYQAWLIRNDESPFRYAILTKNDQGLYTLNVEFKFDPQEPPFTTFDTVHNTIVVSKESVNDDLIETKMLEGTFTQ